MDDRSTPATKKELLEQMLARGMAMIHLDARRGDVDVPRQFRDDPELRLNLSYRFQNGDLEVDGERVRATLSFSGIPYTCVVPLEAVYAMVSHASGESFFFPTDAPAEALAGLAAIVGPLQEDAESSGSEAGDGTDPGMPSLRQRLGQGRPALRAIDGGAAARDDGDADGPEAPRDADAPVARPEPAPATKLRKPGESSEAGAEKPTAEESAAQKSAAQKPDARKSDADDSESEEGAESAEATPRRGHLRLVK